MSSLKITARNRVPIYLCKWRKIKWHEESNDFVLWFAGGWCSALSPLGIRWLIIRAHLSLCLSPVASLHIVSVCAQGTVVGRCLIMTTMMMMMGTSNSRDERTNVEGQADRHRHRGMCVIYNNEARVSTVGVEWDTEDERQVNTHDDLESANDEALTETVLGGAERKLSHLYQGRAGFGSSVLSSSGPLCADHIDLIKWYFIANTWTTSTAHVPLRVVVV